MGVAAGGLFMFISLHPGQARELGLLGAKAQLAILEPTWPSYFGLLAQIAAVGGVLFFGMTVVWIFGREFADHAAKDLLARLGPDGWQIGVGRAHPGIDGIATSLTEAHNTLDLAGKLGFATPVLPAADLLVFPVLLRDRDAITDLVTTVLGPLQQARGGPQSYLDTLSVLFDNQGNYTATARQMHLSVRAVTYRLDRIQALTGYHPSESTQRFTLHAAVLGHDCSAGRITPHYDHDRTGTGEHKGPCRTW